MVQPLDFEYIFVNLFAGSRDIFFFLAVIFFAFLGAKLKMEGGVFMMLLVLFVLMISGISGYKNFLFPLIVLAAGLFIYSLIIRIVNK